MISESAIWFWMLIELLAYLWRPLIDIVTVALLWQIVRNTKIKWS